MYCETLTVKLKSKYPELKWNLIFFISNAAYESKHFKGKLSNNFKGFKMYSPVLDIKYCETVGRK